MKVFRASSGKPSSLRSNSRLPLSRILSTIFSPFTVGTALTLKSMERPSIWALILPSWVFLFSAISMLAIIFSRLSICGCTVLGSFRTTKHLPSLLYLILRYFS